MRGSWTSNCKGITTSRQGRFIRCEFALNAIGVLPSVLCNAHVAPRHRCSDGNLTICTAAKLLTICCAVRHREGAAGGLLGKDRSGGAPHYGRNSGAQIGAAFKKMLDQSHACNICGGQPNCQSLSSLHGQTYYFVPAPVVTGECDETCISFRQALLGCAGLDREGGARGCGRPCRATRCVRD